MACFSSTLLYVKFLALWLLVILADFILEFRFEFLWPFWLLLRSVYDSFKYQGLVSLLSLDETKSSPLTLNLVYYRPSLLSSSALLSPPT